MLQKTLEAYVLKADSGPRRIIVVVASGPAAARELAAESATEDGSVWLDPARTSCEDAARLDRPGVICVQRV